MARKLTYKDFSDHVTDYRASHPFDTVGTAISRSLTELRPDLAASLAQVLPGLSRVSDGASQQIKEAYDFIRTYWDA